VPLCLKYEAELTLHRDTSASLRWTDLLSAGPFRWARRSPLACRPLGGPIERRISGCQSMSGVGALLSGGVEPTGGLSTNRLGQVFDQAGGDAQVLPEERYVHDDPGGEIDQTS